MREQTDSHSFGEATESYDSKKDQPAKKRLIYKEKNLSNMAQQSERAGNKLTKEQRAKIQKQKNRQAAQRSRDMHKEYVTSLQKELVQIKRQLQNSKKYCHRCQQLLDNDNSPLFYSPESTVHLHSDFSCQLDEEPHHSTQINQIPLKEYTEPQSFLRWLQPQEQLPFMKLMLFVCMVVIAIMIIPNEVPVASPPATRALFQKYEQHIGEETVMVNPIEGWQMEGGLVQLNRGIKDQTCLNSLMRVQGPPMIRKSLRSIHQVSYTEQMESIMLCSLRSPDTYQIKAELADSPIVRLFVLGSEIKDLMERSESLFRLSDRNIQLNGIYRLTAEIKSVDLVSHHNCLV